MLIANFKSSSKNIKNDGALKFNDYSFTLSNKHFYTGSHKTLTILSKKIMTNHCANLTESQLNILGLFLKSLNQEGVRHISQVKKTKINKLSYVTVIFDVDGTTYREHLFTFIGFNKLVSYRGIAKYNLDLQTLLDMANQK